MGRAQSRYFQKVLKRKERLNQDLKEKREKEKIKRLEGNEA